jgi:hypothetical protein
VDVVFGLFDIVVQKYDYLADVVFMYQYLYWCDCVVSLCLCTSIYTDVTVW